MSDNLYRSWKCADLNDATLYSSDATVNPDWDNTAPFEVCPLTKCVGYEILNHFDNDIRQSFSTGIPWDSGIIRLAYAYYNGAVSESFIGIRFETRFAENISYLYVHVGIGRGTSFTHYNSHAFLADEYENFALFQRKVYFVRRLRRNFLDEDYPGYLDTQFYVCFFGGVTLYTGSWDGRQMNYRPVLGWGDPAACLISTPCTWTTLDQQSEGVYAVNNPPTAYDIYYADYTDFKLTDATGAADDNPPDPSDPNTEDPGGPSGPGGGDGDHRPSYTPIPIPGLPSIGPNSAGFVFMLRLTTSQMQLFAEDLLYPSWWTALKNFFADPLDFICGIMIVPYSPDSDYNVYPKFGDNTFGHAYPYITQQYKKIDCGELEVSKYFGGAFDQNPYTKLLVWLPYIGYRELDADECVGKRLHIVYHCDCLTGDCVAYISTIAGSGYDVPFERVIAQFSGNCGVRVPFGSTSFDAAIGASIQLLGGAVGAIAKGSLGAAGITAGAITESQIANSIAGSTAEAVQGLKVSTERSGTAGASAGYLSIQYPYLLRTIPRQSLPTNYKDLEGYPSNIAGPLSGFAGYAAIETINLNGIQASKAELDEIRSLLRGGVYI